MFCSTIRFYSTKNCTSYIINEGANLLRVCRPWTIFWGRHKGGSHIITEHVRTVVEAPVQNAQVIVLLGWEVDKLG